MQQNNNKIRRFNPAKRVAGLATMAAVSLLLSGCYFTAALNFTDRTSNVPWWCQGTPDLSIPDCLEFSLFADFAIAFAHQYPTVADFTGGAGAVEVADPATALGAGDSGAVFVLPSPSLSFDATAPNALLYESNASDARLVGVAWVIGDASPGGGLPPEGFTGSRDVWTSASGGENYHMLPVWIVRGYENHPNVFAVNQPCLADGVTLTSTADACFLASHTVPLEVLVVNDDGYAAEGIDALVEGLTDDPNDPTDSFVAGINVQVVAPLTQQSGQGDNLTPGGAPAATPDLTTLSGYEVLAAVHGTPGDSVLWALRQLDLSPDLVLSGINEGQNLASVGELLSGTVGAARTAKRRGFDSIATSQGTPEEPDYETGVEITLEVLELWRLGLAGPPFMEVPNINMPSCSAGTQRGLIETVVGVDLSSGAYFDPPNCLSTKTEGDVVDDLDGHLNGFSTLADMGAEQPPNYP
ncbi:MAG: 5'/3'-nucleotidase SurE [Pseudomonadota bacterium]